MAVPAIPASLVSSFWYKPTIWPSHLESLQDCAQACGMVEERLLIKPWQWHSHLLLAGFVQEHGPYTFSLYYKNASSNALFPDGVNLTRNPLAWNQVGSVMTHQCFAQLTEYASSCRRKRFMTFTSLDFAPMTVKKQILSGQHRSVTCSGGS